MHTEDINQWADLRDSFKMLLKLALLLRLCLCSKHKDKNKNKNIYEQPPKCYAGDILLQLAPFDFSSASGQSFLALWQQASDIIPSGDAGLKRMWRAARREAVAERLKEHAIRTQGKILKELKAAGAGHESFWINNSILVKSPACHLQLMLLAQFSSTEDGILEMLPADRIVAHIPTPIKSRSPLMDRLVSLAVMEGQIPWNLEMIGAKAAWSVSRGKGVTVATIDTGVSLDHPALRNSYRGGANGQSGLKNAVKRSSGLSLIHEHSWFDPQGKSVSPDDAAGHGTHTMGTIVGADIGVAPEATWIAARGCTEKGCTQHDLLACAQWVLCPKAGPSGEERCDLGADIVSNSWGASGTEMLDWFLPAVQAWTAAGIIPVFAIGNEGPACGTAGAPGTFAEVIGVGSVGQGSCLSRFSSKGPAPGPSKGAHYATSKPDLVAPGESILSASHTGPGLVAMSGTSMAAPHVAGALALLLAHDMSLDTHSIQLLIKKSSTTKGLTAPMDGPQICQATRWNAFPESMHYGAGLLNVADMLKSIE